MKAEEIGVMIVFCIMLIIVSFFVGVSLSENAAQDHTNAMKKSALTTVSSCYIASMDTNTCVKFCVEEHQESVYATGYCIKTILEK